LSRPSNQRMSDHSTSFSRAVALSKKMIARSRTGRADTIATVKSPKTSTAMNEKFRNLRLACMDYQSHLLAVFPRKLHQKLASDR
jgi:hypothetical protein